MRDQGLAGILDGLRHLALGLGMRSLAITRRTENLAAAGFPGVYDLPFKGSLVLQL